MARLSPGAASRDDAIVSGERYFAQNIASSRLADPMSPRMAQAVNRSEQFLADEIRRFSDEASCSIQLKWK